MNKHVERGLDALSSGFLTSGIIILFFWTREHWRDAVILLSLGFLVACATGFAKGLLEGLARDRRRQRLERMIAQVPRYRP